MADPEGSDLADLAAAHAKAIAAARDVMSEEVKHGRLCLSCCISIEDGDGRELAKVLFRDALEVTGV